MFHLLIPLFFLGMHIFQQLTFFSGILFQIFYHFLSSPKFSYHLLNSEPKNNMNLAYKQIEQMFSKMENFFKQ